MPGPKENYTTAWTKQSVRLIATPSDFAKRHLYYVQEIGHFQTLPGYYTEREGLDSYLIVYVVKGKGQLIYQEKSYSLTPQGLYYIHCEPYHRYEADPADPLEIRWVHFHGSASEAYFEHYISAHEPYLQLPTDSSASAILQELLLTQQQRTAATEFLSSKLLVELLTTLLLTAQEQALSEAAKPAYIERICQTFEERFMSAITLDELAETHAVSKFHLAKRFKQYTGLSPHEYLIGVRMTRAKEKLKYSDMTVAEISKSCGIENVSHFINLFRDRTGDTPLAYRKKWQRPR